MPSPVLIVAFEDQDRLHRGLGGAKVRPWKQQQLRIGSNYIVADRATEA
jgi:hypothetical protein